MNHIFLVTYYIYAPLIRGCSLTLPISIAKGLQPFFIISLQGNFIRNTTFAEL